MRQTDILIAGGGIAGLTLAHLLAGIGMDVDLIEPFPPEPLKKVKPSGRTVALMDSSLNIVRATGIWDTVKDSANPMRTMRIMDDSRAKQPVIETAFNASDIGLEQFGYNVPNAILRSALYESAKKNKNIKIHPSAFASYEVQGGHAVADLEDGTQIKTRLIVGADGRNSVVRAQAGIAVSQKSYDQKAITCLINHSRAHDNTSTEFHRPSGPFALVPLPGNQSSVVWVETPERADALLRLKKHEFEQALQDNANNILGGITLEVGPQAWPLCSIKAKALTAPRVALVAEAAHVMSPITAQGLNLSLRDIAALAETIADALRVGLDYGSPSILEKYRKRRQIDITTRVFGVDRMNRVVSNDLSFVKDMRRFGLKTTERVAPLKRFAMRTGLAPQIDLGRLAKGEAL